MLFAHESHQHDLIDVQEVEEFVKNDVYVTEKLVNGWQVLSHLPCLAHSLSRILHQDWLQHQWSHQSCDMLPPAVLCHAAFMCTAFVSCCAMYMMSVWFRPITAPSCTVTWCTRQSYLHNTCYVGMM